MARGPLMRTWVAFGVKAGLAHRCGHPAFDGGWVFTLVLRTPEYEARKDW